MRYLILAITLTMHVGAQAGSDSENGRAIAEQACASCHGATGQSTTPTFPILAGQYEDYLALSLRRYADGSRKGPQAILMQAPAAALSEQDILDVSAWFAQQDGTLSTEALGRTDAVVTD